MQSKIKWGMVREEQRQLKAAMERRDHEDMMTAAEFQQNVQEGIDEEWREKIAGWLDESKQWQQHKKALKQWEIAEEAVRISEAYYDQKDMSEYAADLAREKNAERNTWGIEEHLETYQAVRELAACEKQNEFVYNRERRLEEQISTMDDQMRQVAKAREQALRDLEVTRAGARRPLPRAIVLRRDGPM